MEFNSKEEVYSAIFDSPEAPKMIAHLQSKLEEERKRRLNFYNEIDDDMKVEFINGEVVVHSPVKKEHTDVVKYLMLMADSFVRLAKLGYVGYEKVMTVLSRNDYEPDVLFFGNEKAQHFKKGQWKYPAPDFVVEVLSESTEARDRGIKFEDYAAHGVQEYWIIDPVEETIEQYFLEEEKFKLHLKAGQGSIESRVITGFKIEIRAVFDEAENLKAIQKIMVGET